MVITQCAVRHRCISVCKPLHAHMELWVLPPGYSNATDELDTIVLSAPPSLSRTPHRTCANQNKDKDKKRKKDKEKK